MAQERVKRRLTAILAADVAGYSRLMGVDEEGTLTRLKAHHSELIDPKITEHHGRIVKTTGDGLLVEFVSVVDATRCAVEVQRAMLQRNASVPQEKRIEFRVGINVGDIIIDGGDIFGDGVNVAARLEGLAKPNGICLSSAAYAQVSGRLNMEVTDLGETQLKNISEPVRVYALEVSKPAHAKPIKRAAPKQRSILRMLGTALVALIVVAGGAWYFLGANRTVPVKAAHVSIVVLPFVNLSNDPGQDYFADGITDNLTTDLSRIRDSIVIARNTAFTYKGKSINAKEIGKELGVRYVLEGSVQRDQNRVRVNAQLIDAESGVHLWADRFEEDAADLFKLVDQVVARLANALDFQLLKAEAVKGAYSKNPDAIDLDMRGVALLWLPMITKESNNASRAFFEQALKIDPNFADALAGEAWTYVYEYMYGWTNPETDYDAKILGQADRAIALAPDNPYSYTAKSTYLTYSNRPSEALGVANAGLAHRPNVFVLYSARSGAEISLGRFEAAKSDAQQALRLNPRGPTTGIAHLSLGSAELGLGNFDAAINEYHLAIDAGFRNAAAYASLAAVSALVGKMEEAKSALAEARRLNPNLTVKWRIAHGPNIPALFEGLRKAGLAEE
jgi:adenylate cyclase